MGPVFEDERAEEEDRDGKEVVVEHGWKRLAKLLGTLGHINVLSQSLKFIFLMTFLMDKTYAAVQKTFIPIHAYPAFKVESARAASEPLISAWP
jgi:hypothetical protein